MINYFKRYTIRKVFIVFIIVEWILFFMWIFGANLNTTHFLVPFLIVVVDIVHRFGRAFKNITNSLIELQKSINEQNRLSNDRFKAMIKLAETGDLEFPHGKITEDRFKINDK